MKSKCKYKSGIAAVGVLMLCLALIAAVSAQCGNTTTIYGKALDLHNNPILGANITAEKQSMMCNIQLGNSITNATGDYIIYLNISGLSESFNDVDLKLDKNGKKSEEYINISCSDSIYENIAYRPCLSPTEIYGHMMYPNGSRVLHEMNVTLHVDGRQEDSLLTNGSYYFGVSIPASGSSDFLITAENGFMGNVSGSISCGGKKRTYIWVMPRGTPTAGAFIEWIYIEDEATAAPLSGVMINIYYTNGTLLDTATESEPGNYTKSFSGIAPGMCYLTATKPGYLTWGSYHLDPPGFPCDETHGQPYWLTLGPAFAKTPDLAVANLTHTPQNPTPGDNVTTTATIQNSGNLTAENLTSVNVSLFIDNVYENSKIINLTNKYQEEVNFTWVAVAGEHDVTIKVDSDDAINETNEGNNNATTQIIGYACFDLDSDTYYGFDMVYCPMGDDCNDSDQGINPNATDICNNSVDEDCDGVDMICNSQHPPPSSPIGAKIGAKIGYSTGGAKDINNFCENINNSYLPLPTDITYEGLFYDYYFDTGEQEECQKLFCPSYSYGISRDPFSDEEDYYLSVGLNSGINESDFQRKKLNIVIVLDVSGSMSSTFNSYYYDRFGNKRQIEEDEDSGKSKMRVASESVVGLLDHLEEDDRFGMVLFECNAHLVQPLDLVGDTDMQKLKDYISGLSAGGCTQMSAGMETGTELFEGFLDINQSEYENRIIFLTDAMPNTGDTSEQGLLGMTKNNSGNKIYTTFIGIGVDFNTELVEYITKIRGANYYSVHSAKQFKERMDDEFEYMVTPLVFNLELKMESDGYEIEKVYGSPEANESTGEIMKVNTLFPSKRLENETRGGLVLLKLKKLSSNGSLKLKVTYEDRMGGIDGDETEIELEEKEPDFFENTGIRKGILLARYADLMKNWIIDELNAYETNESIMCGVDTEKGITIPNVPLGKWERQSVPLRVSEHYRELFEEFAVYFESEMNAIGDDTLSQELAILNKLSKNTSINNNVCNNTVGAKVGSNTGAKIGANTGHKQSHKKRSGYSSYSGVQMPTTTQDSGEILQDKDENETKQEIVSNEMHIIHPEEVTRGEPFTITVIDENKNPVESAAVEYNGIVKKTDASGKVDFIAAKGDIELKASKDGYESAITSLTAKTNEVEREESEREKVKEKVSEEQEFEKKERFNPLYMIVPIILLFVIFLKIRKK